MKILMTFLRVFLSDFYFRLSIFISLFSGHENDFFLAFLKDEKQIFMQIASVGDVNNFSWHFLFSFIRRESETLAQSANIRQDLSRWIGVCVF